MGRYAVLVYRMADSLPLNAPLVTKRFQEVDQSTALRWTFERLQGRRVKVAVQHCSAASSQCEREEGGDGGGPAHVFFRQCAKSEPR